MTLLVIILIFMFFVVPPVSLFFAIFFGVKTKKMNAKILELENKILMMKSSGVSTEMPAETVETVSESVETVSESVETVSESVETVSETVETVSESVETVSESVETVAETEKPVAETIGNPTKGYNFSYRAETEIPKKVFVENNVQAEIPREIVRNAPKNSKVSTISIILILGATFLNIAGLIFATNSWDSLNQIFKIATLFSFSVVFFGLSLVAKFPLKLEKTGFTFHVIGSFFLPITVVGASFLEVFGEWFSFTGDGVFALLGTTLALLFLTTLIGSLIYKNKFMVHCGLVSLSGSLFFFLYQIFNDLGIVSIFIGIYTLVFIIIGALISKTDKEKLNVVSSQMAIFANYNALILAVVPLIGTFTANDHSITSFIGSGLFASCFLINAPRSKSYTFSIYMFLAFITLAFFSAITPYDVSSYGVFMLCVVTVPMILSSVTGKLERFNNVISFASSILNITVISILAFMSLLADVNVTSLIVYSILSVEILVLTLVHSKKNIGGIYRAILPFALLITAVSYVKFFFDGDFDFGIIMFAAIVLVLQTLFVFLRKLNIRSSFSDIAFQISSVISVIALSVDVLQFEYTNLILVFVISLATVLIPIFKSSYFTKSLSLFFATVALAFAIGPTMDFYYTSDFIGILPTLLGAIIVTAVSLALLYKSKSKLLVISYGIISRVALYVFGLFLYEICEVSSPMFLLFTIISIAYGFKRKSTINMVFGLYSFIFGCGILSEEVFPKICGTEGTLACAIGALIISLVAMFLFEEDSHVKKLYESISRFSLMGLLAISILVNIFNYDYTVIGFVLTVVLLAYTINLFYMKRTPAWILIPLLIFAYDFSNIITNTFDIDVFAMMADGFEFDLFVNSMIVVLFTVLSLLIHPKKLFDKDEKFYFDVFAVAKILVCIPIFFDSFSGENDWIGFIVVAFAVATLIRKEQNIIFKKCNFSFLIFDGILLLALQELVEIPSLIENEYYAILWIAFPIIMTYIWDGTVRKVFNIIVPIMVSIEYVVLIIAADGIFNALFISITAVLLLIVSFIIKVKKWFVISLVVILASMFIMTGGYWENLAWWLFYVVAGILLICLGVANELKKQKAIKEGKPKTRFMSEWKW